MRGQRHAPTALYTRERPGTHCTGGWVGPRASLAPPTGFDPRTVQPVASRYTDYATRPTYMCRFLENRQPKISVSLNRSLSRPSEVFLVCYWHSTDGQLYVSLPYITQFLHCMEQKIRTHFPGVSEADDDDDDVSLSELLGFDP